MSRNTLRAALAATFVCLSSSLAQAGTLGVANDFNGFVFGNLTALGGQDTEGRLAVGGNMNATSYSVGHGVVGPSVPYFPPPNTLDNLIVGGNLEANGWQVFNGNAVYGGSLIGSVSFSCGGCHAYQGNKIDFEAARADLEAKSDYWATLPTNADIDYDGYYTITLTATHDGLNVFNVDPAIWAHTSSKLIVNPFPNATLLINVPGQNPTQQYGMRYNGSDTPSSAHSKVLFNYNEAQTLLTSNMGLLGSVLAPYADLTINSGGINGVGIANNVVQTNGGEFHNFTFTGDLPSPPPAVPEPGTAVMLMLGAAGMTGARRKR